MALSADQLAAIAKAAGGLSGGLTSPLTRSGLDAFATAAFGGIPDQPFAGGILPSPPTVPVTPATPTKPTTPTTPTPPQTSAFGSLTDPQKLYLSGMGGAPRNSGATFHEVYSPGSARGPAPISPQLASIYKALGIDPTKMAKYSNIQAPSAGATGAAQPSHPAMNVPGANTLQPAQQANLRQVYDQILHQTKDPAKASAHATAHSHVDNVLNSVFGKAATGFMR